MSDERPELAEVLNFTDDDLLSNRDGVLSPLQETRLRSRTGCSTIAGALLTLSLAGIGFWLVAVGVWWLGAFLFAGAAALFYFSRLGGNTTTDALRSGSVMAATGPVMLDTHDYASPNGHVTEYRLTVDNETFVLGRNAFSAFIDGELYTVYYLPGARIVLSAERQVP